MGDSPDLPRQHRSTVQRRRDRFGEDATPDPDFKISARFSKDLNLFANSTAHALRRKVKFGSDDGKVARGLVLDSDPSGSLYRIHHQALRDDAVHEGMSLWLWCRLWRRKSRIPSERWAIAVQFERFWTNKEFSSEELETTQSPQARAARIIREAQQVAGSIPGDKGKRIRAWLKLAEEKGHPAMLDLWHYNRVAVHEFAWASAKEQNEMIKRGGGFPLRGKLAGTWQSGAPDWRIYPFRGLLLMAFDSQPKLWKLKDMDDMLGKSLQELTSAPGGKGAGGESAVSEPTRRLRQHLIQLARQPGNLYYESDRNTQDRRGILEW